MTSPLAARAATRRRRRSSRAPRDDRPARGRRLRVRHRDRSSATATRGRRFRGRTRAALGNHEYGTGTAAAAIAYFGLPRRGYYSYELGDWHVVVLNSNCRPAGGCGPGSPQQRWLAADLREHPTRCAVAYMHHPRFSSGIHGSDPTIAALWTTLSRGGVDVVLAGHDHHYERFAPFEGIRSFVVGTGGRSLYPTLGRVSRPASVVRQSRPSVFSA